MTDAGTTQDNFILPALPVGGLPISQDWLDSSNSLSGENGLLVLCLKGTGFKSGKQLQTKQHSPCPFTANLHFSIYLKTVEHFLLIRRHFVNQ